MFKRLFYVSALWVCAAGTPARAQDVSEMNDPLPAPEYFDDYYEPTDDELIVDTWQEVHLTNDEGVYAYLAWGWPMEDGTQAVVFNDSHMEGVTGFRLYTCPDVQNAIWLLESKNYDPGRFDSLFALATESPMGVGGESCSEVVTISGWNKALWRMLRRRSNTDQNTEPTSGQTRSHVRRKAPWEADGFFCYFEEFGWIICYYGEYCFFLLNRQSTYLEEGIDCGWFMIPRPDDPDDDDDDDDGGGAQGIRRWPGPQPTWPTPPPGWPGPFPPNPIVDPYEGPEFDPDDPCPNPPCWDCPYPGCGGDPCSVNPCQDHCPDHVCNPDCNPDYLSCDACGAITIVEQPHDLTGLCTGTNQSLRVEVQGASPFSFQWYKDDVSLGFHSNVLPLSVMDSGVNGVYHCVITNECGSQESNRVTVSVDGEIYFTDHPVGQAVHYRGDVTISASVFSHPPTSSVSYLWRRNNHGLDNDDHYHNVGTDQLTITDFQPQHVGDYSVNAAVYPPMCLATSNAARLTLAEEDCNGNGRIDWREIVYDGAADCDENGTPDECQPELAAPPAPEWVGPANGSVGHSLSPAPTLEWTETGPNDTYLVWFGVGSQIAGEGPVVVTGTQYQPRAPLAAGTTYTWRVMARRDTVCGDTLKTWGPKWTFTTTSDASDCTDPVLELPQAPSPAHDPAGATPVDYGWPGLAWSGDAQRYHVKMGPDPQNLNHLGDTEETVLSFEEPLTALTHYYWQVIAKSNACEGGMDVEVAGPVWEFWTNNECLPREPAVPADPVPIDQEEGVSGGITTLSWQGGENDQEYVVYFGLAEGALMGQEPTTQSQWNLTTALVPDQWYQWKVVAKTHSCGTEQAAESPIWTFKTCAAGELITPDDPDPAHDETRVAMDRLLQWDGDADVATFTLHYIGYSNLNDDQEPDRFYEEIPTSVIGSPAGGTDRFEWQQDLTQLWLPDYRYFWRIDTTVHDACGGVAHSAAGTGPQWRFDTLAADGSDGGGGCNPRPPGVPELVRPVPGAVNVSQGPLELRWTQAGKFYEVYFGEASIPDDQLPKVNNILLTQPRFSVMVDESQFYKWYVVARNACSPTEPGITATSAIATFSTGIGCSDPQLGWIDDPIPAQGAELDYAGTLMLEWTLMDDPTTDSDQSPQWYDVYFWESGEQPPTEPVSVPGHQRYLDVNVLSNHTYYWRVVARTHGCFDQDVVRAGPTWSFSTHDCDAWTVSTPTSPTPATTARDVPLNIELTWTGDPMADEYFIWFGEGGSAKWYVSTGRETAFSPPASLELSTTYTWNVTAVRRTPCGYELTQIGPDWTFTTTSDPADCVDEITPPSTPTPWHDPAGDHRISYGSQKLKWYGDAQRYHVFLGTDPQNLAYLGETQDLYFKTDPLQTMAHYYWQVIAKSDACDDTIDLLAAGPVWEFWTNDVCNEVFPRPVNTPQPYDGEQDVYGGSQSLAWQGSSDNQEYAVRFGPLNGALGELGTTTGNIWELPVDLDASRWYQWQIVSRTNTCGTVHEVEGPIWTFKTCAADPIITPDAPNPADGQTLVGVEQLPSWDGDANYVWFRLLFDGTIDLGDGEGAYNHYFYDIVPVRLLESQSGGSARFEWLTDRPQLWYTDAAYAWQIDTWKEDQCDGILHPVLGTGREWSFETIAFDGSDGGGGCTPQAPEAPEVVYPENAAGALSQGLIELRWTDTGMRYDVYFGEASVPDAMLPRVVADLYETSLGVLVDPGVAYKWYVVARNSCLPNKPGLTTAGDIWTFSTAEDDGTGGPGANCSDPDPGMVFGPYPANESASTGQGTIKLRWLVADNNPENAVAFYDVYVGLSPTAMPLIGTVPGYQRWIEISVDAGETYYWKVIAKAPGCFGVDVTTEGPPWWFSTCTLQQNPPEYYWPLPYEKEVASETSLAWQDVGAFEYQVELGPVETGMVTQGVVDAACDGVECTWSPLPLQRDTRYAWRIGARIEDACGNRVSVFGPVWVFDTEGCGPPRTPQAFWPVQGQSDVPATTSLSRLQWLPQPDADRYDVYFGPVEPPDTSFEGNHNILSVRDSRSWADDPHPGVPSDSEDDLPLTGSCNMTLQASDITETFWEPDHLAPDTLYCWQVVAKRDNPCGGGELIKTGFEWRFQTCKWYTWTTPQRARPLRPIQGSGNHPIEGVQLSWQGYCAEHYEVLMDTVNPPMMVVATVPTAYWTTPPLESAQTYYWRIRSYAENFIDPTIVPSLGTISWFRTRGECERDFECNDGQFCNGSEVCLDGLCQSASDPCPGQMCREMDDACVDCLEDADCQDGTFCNGDELCQDDVCQPGTAPCSGAQCDETLDQCVECLTHSDCDDGLYCSGVETCGAGGVCQAGTSPCSAGEYCNEQTDACADCLSHSDCDDANPCTNDTCQSGACVHVNNQASCSDGIFCNGSEVCAGGTCQPGSDPCPSEVCDESSDQCVGCLSDMDCDDGVYCNGAETCSGSGLCQSGAVPCPGTLCREPDQMCVDCLDDADCDDDTFCNGLELCSNGTCIAGSDPCAGQMCREQDDVCVMCLEDVHCDNGTYCDGAEACSPAGECEAGIFPCEAGQICVEASDTCVNCQDNADCDNAVYCDGAELCLDGVCVGGLDPCPGQFCDESSTQCLDCYTDPDCDDGLFCSGSETCAEGVCLPGESPCGSADCDDVLDQCDTHVRLDLRAIDGSDTIVVTSGELFTCQLHLTNVTGAELDLDSIVAFVMSRSPNGDSDQAFTITAITWFDTQSWVDVILSALFGDPAGYAVIGVDDPSATSVAGTLRYPGTGPPGRIIADGESVLLATFMIQAPTLPGGDETFTLLLSDQPYQRASLCDPAGTPIGPVTTGGSLTLTVQEVQP